MNIGKCYVLCIVHSCTVHILCLAVYRFICTSITTTISCLCCAVMLSYDFSRQPEFVSAYIILWDNLHVCVPSWATLWLCDHDSAHTAFYYITNSRSISQLPTVVICKIYPVYLGAAVRLKKKNPVSWAYIPGALETHWSVGCCPCSLITLVTVTSVL